MESTKINDKLKGAVVQTWCFFFSLLLKHSNLIICVFQIQLLSQKTRILFRNVALSSFSFYVLFAVLLLASLTHRQTFPLLPSFVFPMILHHRSQLHSLSNCASKPLKAPYLPKNTLNYHFNSIYHLFLFQACQLNFFRNCISHATSAISVFQDNLV